VVLKHFSRIVTIYVIGNVRQAPIEWAHQAVVVTLVIPVFPPVHVIAPKSHHRKVGDPKGERYKSKKARNETLIS
jgi:hypothetical protein